MRSSRLPTPLFHCWRNSLFVLVVGSLSLSALLVVPQQGNAQQSIPPTSAVNLPIRVGWIGAMTGGIVKYGAQNAAALAMDDINSAGGIHGRKLELIFEDGKGEGRAAVDALHKLLSVDGVRLLLGGHCSPESLAMAPVVQQSGAVMLAAITSSPKLSGAGENIFRVSPISTIVAEKVIPYAVKKRGSHSIAILFEETDYARPPAERAREVAEREGLEVVSFESYMKDSVDVRSLVTKLGAKRPDLFYLGVQSPDMAVQILRQMYEQHVRPGLLGNEITGNAIISASGKPEHFDGMVFAEPDFNPEAPRTAAFLEAYRKRYGAPVPMGFWTAEAYDSVQVMANAIRTCGETSEDVKRCLLKLDGFPGVSGSITLDKNGDGVRSYVLKQIRAGKIATIPDL